MIVCLLPPAPPPMPDLDFSRLIVFYADPESREVAYDFPEPEGGPLKHAQIPGTNDFVLDFRNATVEQLAHHHFWANDAAGRIHDLIANGRGAGLRQTLRWLVTMRMKEAYEKTGWVYHLAFLRQKEDWEMYRRVKAAAKAAAKAKTVSE